MRELDDQMVTLTLDNDEEIECAILTILEVANREYIALVPLDDEDDETEESDIYLYRFQETPDGDPELSNIEDDEEYEAVADALDEWFDEQEFDELHDEEDE